MSCEQNKYSICDNLGIPKFVTAGVPSKIWASVKLPKSDWINVNFPKRIAKKNCLSSLKSAKYLFKCRRNFVQSLSCSLELAISKKNKKVFTC